MPSGGGDVPWGSPSERSPTWPASLNERSSRWNAEAWAWGWHRWWRFWPCSGLASGSSEGWASALAAS